MENFSEWFHDVLEEAEIIDSRYPIKGMSVWLPNGFKIRKYVLKELRNLLDLDHDEVLFPLLIPEAELAKEGIHVKGFEDEVYWITHGGKNELNEKLALRPTSETAIYPMYALWLRSHIDLPMKFYQIVNTFRYETKHTRPLIRVREITTFKEAHTIHSTYEEASNQVDTAVELYKQFFDSLCIPYIFSKRPSWDTFPGADYTMAFDTIMPDGKTLQIGTVHNLGQTFAKTFNILFENIDGEQEYAYQTCYGISERIIASLIAVHGDDKGLVLPPLVAPFQVVIVPIIFKKGKEEVLEKCDEIQKQLKDSGIRVSLDDRDIRAGKKYYEIEKKGSPVRLEIGPRDIKNNVATLVRRDTMEKTEVSLDTLIEDLTDLMSSITDNLKSSAWKNMDDKIKKVSSLDEIETVVSSGNIAQFSWCGSDDCGKDMEEKTNFDILGTTDKTDGVCLNCGKEGQFIVNIAKTY